MPGGNRESTNHRRNYERSKDRLSISCQLNVLLRLMAAKVYCESGKGMLLGHEGLD